MTDATCSIDGCESARATRGWCWRHYSRWYDTGSTDLAVYPSECSWCGSSIPDFLRYGVPRKYCSASCGTASRADKLSASRKEESASRRRSTVKSCPQCGREFSPEKTTRQKFCTKKCSAAFFRDRSGTCSADECDRPVRARGLCSMHWKRWSRSSGSMPAEEWTDRRRANYHRRRALKRNLPADTIVSADVYERDGWICGICEGEVGRDARYPDPMSPSLDHIVPLSKGGHHVLSNVQLAHLDCNVRKGDRDSIAA